MLQNNYFHDKPTCTDPLADGSLHMMMLADLIIYEYAEMVERGKDLDFNAPFFTSGIPNEDVERVLGFPCEQEDWQVVVESIGCEDGGVQ